MKYTILILALILLLGCHGDDCDRGDYPNAPYGPADSWDEYDGSGDYKSVTYTYYCYQGEYHSITYTSGDKCEEWYESSHFRSNCI